MADEYILKHLQDVMQAIADIERCFENFPMRFDCFEQDMMRICTVERKTEIMGEAINRILKRTPDFYLPNSRAIVNTRNRIIHGYDSVEPEFLWSLVIRHIPQLKIDIEAILQNYE